MTEPGKLTNIQRAFFLNRSNRFIVECLLNDKKIRAYLPNPGRLGEIQFKKGYSLYVCSAGKNLAQRINRHRRVRKKLFWHIDYLRERTDFIAALPVRTQDQLECKIAKALRGISDWSIDEFGVSDCSCRTHLFGMNENPTASPQFINTLLYCRIDRLNHQLEINFPVSEL